MEPVLVEEVSEEVVVVVEVVEPVVEEGSEAVDCELVEDEVESEVLAVDIEDDEVVLWRYKM